MFLYLSSKLYTALNARTIRCNRTPTRRLKQHFSPTCRRLFDLSLIINLCTILVHRFIIPCWHKGHLTTFAYNTFLQTLSCTAVPTLGASAGRYAIAMLYPSIGLGPPDVTTPRDSTRVVIMVQPSGVVIMVQPSRVVIMVQPSGVVIMVQPSGVVIMVQPSGVVIMVQPSGVVIMVQPSRVVIMVQPSRVVIMVQPSGVVIMVQPSGVVIMVQPSGVVIMVQPSGVVIMVQPSGVGDHGATIRGG